MKSDHEDLLRALAERVLQERELPPGEKLPFAVRASRSGGSAEVVLRQDSFDNAGRDSITLRGFLKLEEDGTLRLYGSDGSAPNSEPVMTLFSPSDLDEEIRKAEYSRIEIPDDAQPARPDP